MSDIGYTDINGSPGAIQDHTLSEARKAGIPTLATMASTMFHSLPIMLSRMHLHQPSWILPSSLLTSKRWVSSIVMSRFNSRGIEQTRRQRQTDILHFNTHCCIVCILVCGDNLTAGCIISGWRNYILGLGRAEICNFFRLLGITHLLFTKQIVGSLFQNIYQIRRI